MQNFEQMMNLYHGIFIGCGIATMIFFVFAVVVFILLKIPDVFGELSGRAAKKAIQKMEKGLLKETSKLCRCTDSTIALNQPGFQVIRSIVIVHAKGVE